MAAKVTRIAIAAEIRDKSNWLYDHYLGLVEAGFTEEQALAICARMAAGAGDA